MFFVSTTISIITAAVEFFTKGRMVIVVVYAFIAPVLLLSPRIILRLNSGIKNNVNGNWLKNMEHLGLIVLILNAPASLILHEMGFQYDRFLHFGAAFFLFLFFLLLYLPIKANKEKIPGKRMAIFLILLLLFIGLFFWEGLQHGIDHVFATKFFYDAEQDIRVDFAEDIFFGFLGILAGAMYANHHFGKILSSLKVGENH